MTNKRKKRVRALSKKTGMSYQAASNTLKPESNRREFSDPLALMDLLTKYVTEHGHGVLDLPDSYPLRGDDGKFHMEPSGFYGFVSVSPANETIEWVISKEAFELWEKLTLPHIPEDVMSDDGLARIGERGKAAILSHYIKDEIGRSKIALAVQAAAQNTNRRPSLPVHDFVERREVTPRWSEDKQTVEELIPGPTKSSLTVQSPSGKTYELDAPEELLAQVSKAWQAMTKVSKEVTPEFDPKNLSPKTLKLQMDMGYGEDKSIRSLVEIPMGSGEDLIEQMLAAEPLEPKVSVVEKFVDNDKDWRREREAKDREDSKSQPAPTFGPYRLPTYIPLTSSAFEREYVHFSYMIEDLLDYITVKPSRVESRDNPKTRRIGFITRGLDGYELVEWLIPLTYLMYYMKKEQPIEGLTDTVLRELIKSAAGRAKLAVKLEEIAHKRREEVNRLGTAEGTGSV